ncbi:MAG: hypothetical protein IRZ16_20285, partial [Myxococcaceae bacterium]|nr:hypothetical protein [Myxococcaceae bacterium]
MNQVHPLIVSRFVLVTVARLPWCVATVAALVLLLSPARAQAGGLRLAAEFPDVTWNGLTRKLSAQRFVYVGVQADRSQKGQQAVAHYRLRDLQERKVVDLPIPFRALPKSHAQVLGRTDPLGEVVHTDGQVTSLTYNATKGYQTTATYFCRYDHRTHSFSELVKLTDWNDSQHLEDIGFDPLDRYFYYATALNPAGNVKEAGYTALVLGRVDLHTRAIDWTMKVELPKRAWPLRLTSGPKVFSADGRKLALVEYNDRGLQGDHPANPQQQVLVVDIPSRQVDRYPAPLTAYGVMFSRDDRYLILGSNQTGEIVRIDLQKKRVDRRVKAKKLIHQLVPTASGESFLVLSNTQLASPKVVEVRRVADLSLQTSIPMRLLYAGNDGVAPYGIAGVGGRALLL